MRVGILLSPPPTGTDVAGCFDHLIATARRAEQAGYSSVWIGETHFSNDRPEPVPLVFAGALAAETDSIRLGMMVKLALEHPLKIAEDAAVLDVISGGRTLFAADPGAGADETAGYGVAAVEQRSRFSEALDIIVNAWTSDAFAYLGKHHTLPAKTNAATAGAAYVAEPYAPPYVDPWQRVDQPFDYLSVLPKPAQIPHPPVFVVAGDDEAVALAAAKGYSPLIRENATAEQITGRATAFWRALDAAGRGRSETVLTIARDLYLHSGESGGPGLAENVIAGTPGTVLDRLKQLQHDTGLGQILCRFDVPGVTTAQAARSLTLFAAEVRPRLEM
jgi:alkanesulfonate monooxygenase SsuD/methylene tetrahydromethanopterin reductase-like flavin-dependent oxidoreductase (luciferase family)